MNSFLVYVGLQVRQDFWIPLHIVTFVFHLRVLEFQAIESVLVAR